MGRPAQVASPRLSLKDIATLLVLPLRNRNSYAGNYRGVESLLSRFGMLPCWILSCTHPLELRRYEQRGRTNLAVNHTRALGQVEHAVFVTVISFQKHSATQPARRGAWGGGIDSRRPRSEIAGQVGECLPTTTATADADASSLTANISNEPSVDSCNIGRLLFHLRVLAQPSLIKMTLFYESMKQHFNAGNRLMDEKDSDIIISWGHCMLTKLCVDSIMH